MLNKLKKVKGFTLIELIIVIAIIAILAAIAVPAFGQIRQKANASADLGNARTIYSLVSTEIASDNIELPEYTTPGNPTTAPTTMYYPLTLVGEGELTAGAVDIDAQIEPKAIVKSVQDAEFVVAIDSNGKIQIGYSKVLTDGEDALADAPDDYQVVYPTVAQSE